MNYKELKKSILLSSSENDPRYESTFKKVLSNASILNNIDTSDVKASHWPYTVERTTLRSDDLVRIVKREELAKNTNIVDGYVVITGEENE